MLLATRRLAPAVGVVGGQAVLVGYLTGAFAPPRPVGYLLAALVGWAGERAIRCYLPREAWRFVVFVLAPAAGVTVTALLVVVPLDPVVPLCLTAGGGLGLAVTAGRRAAAVATSVGLAGVSVFGSVAGAGAWSVDEPSPSDPRMVAGDGVVVGMDTHAFLIRQGDRILRHDGRTAIADFLDSPDPGAPWRHDASGRRLGTRESYLWRVQLGARDADRSLKPQMPDHFFNWWTHSGKGLIAGPSAATWAEQQFADAVRAWRQGDRDRAMYHLGAATHLVDDGCTPPHESELVPNHRAYEEWVLGRQASWAVERGGIYQADFRVGHGHGGADWSSAHTRGWVDECAHAAAALVVNSAQPPPGDPLSGGAYLRTRAHFEFTQRITAGYLAFFFDHVGGP
ncbi:MAG TPA: hypothetical protein VFR99_02935 [Marmoricola sp.]|nr:hypothetical protein [Marmoricola sp.]